MIMPDTDHEPVVVKPADPPPADLKQGETGETYTKAQVEELIAKKLRGQGKELADREAKLKAYEAAEAKRAQDAMSAEERHAAAVAALAEKDARLKTLEEEKQARLIRVEEMNADRIKALPKDTKELAKKLSADLNPDKLSEILGDLERQVEVRDVAHGGRVARPVAEMTDDEHRDHMVNWGRSIMQGKKGGAK